MRYKYTKKEFDTLVKNIVVVYDTREQQNEHILTYFNKKGIKYKKRKLDEGVNVVLSVDIKGALKVKEEYDDAIFIFVLPSSLERLKERIKADNKIETPEALARKFNSAYKEITAISKYNYGVVANNIDEAVSKIEHIIAAESCRVSRVKSYIKLD